MPSKVHKYQIYKHTLFLYFSNFSIFLFGKKKEKKKKQAYKKKA